MYRRGWSRKTATCALLAASICFSIGSADSQKPGASTGRFAAFAQQQGSVPAREVSRLVKDLSSADDQVRWQSLLSLQAVTPISSASTAVPAVIHVLLNDSSPQVRGLAAEALSHLPFSDASVKALFSVLNDPQEDLRWRAANAIPARKRFLPLIIRGLKNQDWEVETRMLAKIETLATEAVSAVGALTQELSDNNPVVRAGAARALLKIGPAAYAAGPALMTSLRKEQDAVARSCAVRALVRTGGATASDLPDLIRLLKDPDPSTRYNTAKIIGNLGSVAQPALTDLVLTMNNDPNSLVRCYCAEALGNIGPAAQPATADLIKFLEDRLKDNYRHQAAAALAKIAPANDPKVTRVLLSALMDKSSDVKAYAARGLALMHSQDPRVVPALQNLATDPDAKLRRAASESLKQLALEAEVKGSDEARQVDLSALSSKEVLVRFSALRKLKALLVSRPNEAPAYVAVDENPDLIQRLARILSDSDPSNRTLAAESLGLMGTKAQAAIPALLVQLTSSTDHASVRSAAQALGTVGAGDSRVIAELTRMLSGGGVGVDAFADALGCMGKPAVRGLIVGVESASPMSAYYAAQALGNMGAVAKEAVPALISVLVDSKTPAATREQAADALRKLDPSNPAVADELKRLAQEKAGKGGP